MKPRHKLFMLVIVAVALAACGSPTSTPVPPTPTATAIPTAGPTTTPMPPLPPSPLGEAVLGLQIAFQSDRDGNFEIYIMTVPDDPSVRLAAPINITKNRGNDASPAWSPDGSRIAFHSDRDGNLELYLINPDGTGLIRLTDTSARETSPTWSPDGKKLAYVSRDDEGWDILVMDVPHPGGTVTGDPVRLTDSNDVVGSPAWSPDGRSIAFSLEPNHYSSQIQALNTDGSGLQYLTSGGSYHDFHPAWSPDGNYLAFASERVGHLRFELYVKGIPQDSRPVLSPSAQLTNLDGHSWTPDWSPDGTRIAFSASPAGENSDLYYLFVPTGDKFDSENGPFPKLIRLTDNPARDEHPSWAPLP